MYRKPSACADESSFQRRDDDYEDEDIADADEPGSLGTCIVCQEELNTSKPFGALGLIQPSKLVRRQPDGNGGLMNDVMSSPYSLDRNPPASEIPTFPPRGEALHDPKVTTFEVFPPQNIRFGLHASICSHLMHLDCFNAYTLSIRQRHRTQAARNHPESIPRKEYICPLCKSLGNVILPVSHPAPIQLNTLPFADWTRAAGISILKSKSDPLLDSLLINNGTGELVFWGAQDPGYVSFFRAGDRCVWRSHSEGWGAQAEQLQTTSRNLKQECYVDSSPVLGSLRSYHSEVGRTKEGKRCDRPLSSVCYPSGASQR